MEAPPPSQIHGGAEAAFRAIVAKEVVDLYVASPVCDTVQALDDQVQRGLVRRQAAAFLASGMMKGPMYDTNLLRCVLTNKHKTPECDCLETVLSWGCCPTQVVQYASDREDTTPSAFGLVLVGISIGRERDRCLRSLLHWGTMPWRGFRLVTVAKDGARAVVMPLTERKTTKYSAHGLLLQAQWRRWHFRRGKRQWVAI